MAQLIGVTYPASQIFLNLSIFGENNKTLDADEYTLDIQSDGISFLRKFSVSSWQMEHDDIWILAKGFKELKKRMEQETQIQALLGKDYLRGTYFTRCGPINLTMWVHKPKSSVVGYMFVEEIEGHSLYRKFHFRTPLEEAVEFGRTLEREIALAAPNWASQYESLKR